MKLERLLWVSLLCAPTALAAPDLADLAGTYKRVSSKDKSETVLRFELDGDTLLSSLEGLDDGLECTGRFKLKGNVLRGKVRWVDTEFGTDSTVPWKFTFEDDAQKARGSCGWLDTRFEPFKRGYTIYFLERLDDAETTDTDTDTGDTDTGDTSSGGREGWITSDGGEEPSGESISGGRLYGGWKGPGGSFLVNSKDGTSLTIKPIDHSEGLVLQLNDEDGSGVFRGEASYDGGTCSVELAHADDRLFGRASWSEDGEDGWAPVEFERLERIDVGSKPSDQNTIEPGTDGDVAGAFRRDDGLYLRLNADGEGELVAKDGTLSCRVRLSNEGGVWTGVANWDGVETQWELARTESGFEGRCEWVDHNDGKVAVRGWSARSFEQLQRAN